MCLLTYMKCRQEHALLHTQPPWQAKHIPSLCFCLTLFFLCVTDPKINLSCRNPLISQLLSLTIINSAYLLSSCQQLCTHGKTKKEVGNYYAKSVNTLSPVGMIIASLMGRWKMKRTKQNGKLGVVDSTLCL